MSKRPPCVFPAAVSRRWTSRSTLQLQPEPSSVTPRRCSYNRPPVIWSSPGRGKCEASYLGRIRPQRPSLPAGYRFRGPVPRGLLGLEGGALLPTTMGTRAASSATLTLGVMVAFRRVGRMIGSAGRAAGIAGHPYRPQSSKASIARRMGAGSMGQAATIRARSAAKAAASSTAPEFAPPSSELLEFPVFSWGVLVPCPPLLKALRVNELRNASFCDVL